MGKKEKELAHRYLTLIKFDAENLYNRVNDRKEDFMDAFSLKRDRSIFTEIFFNRYENMSMSELSNFSTEIIELVNEYYLSFDELYWYLKKTQDMPNTIEDEITRSCIRLEKKLVNLKLYIDAELSGTTVSPEDIYHESDVEVDTPEFLVDTE